MLRKSPTATATPDWPALFDALGSAAASDAVRRFYAAGVVDGQTPLGEVPFVALDLETTGLDPDRDGIVSIGLVPLSIGRIHCSGARYWVVRPRRPLSSESVVIHGITHQDLQAAPDFSTVIGDVLGALAGCVVVVHYRAIERRFLRSKVRDRLGDRLEFPVVDTMELEARTHRRWSHLPWVRRLAALVGRQPKSIRLAQSRARYHLPAYGAHHALTDALATAELFQAQVAHRYSADTPIRELWC